MHYVHDMGKGDKDRTTDREKYEKNYARVFEPKEPLKADAEKHEDAFRRNECKNKDIG